MGHFSNLQPRGISPRGQRWRGPLRRDDHGIRPGFLGINLANSSARASSRPARALHAANAASAVGCAGTCGVDCAARDLVVVAALIVTAPAPGMASAESARPPTNKCCISCFSRQSAADRWRRGWRRKSATGADPSRAGRRLRWMTLRVRKGPVPDGRPSDASVRTCRRGRSSDPIDRARGEAAGLRPFRSDWTADQRRDVRHVDRPGIRRQRRHRNRDRYGLGTWAGIGPGSGGGTGGGVVPPWRGGIRTAPDQRGQAE